MPAAHLVDRVARLTADLLEVVLQRPAAASSSSSTRFTPARLRPAARELGDATQPIDVALAVAAVAADRARRIEQALALVDAQRLRMHAGELGRDRDHVHTATSVSGTSRFSSHHTSRWARGDSSLAFASSSIALRSARAQPRRHQRPRTSRADRRSFLPFDTPRPFTRRGFDSGTDGLIFSFTGPPSSVGTSTCAPRAASG